MGTSRIAGGKFNDSCIKEPGVPSVRFIAAGRKQATVRVATEWGGFAPRTQIDEFVLNPGDRIASVRKDVR